jgi:hypothetical protein
MLNGCKKKIGYFMFESIKCKHDWETNNKQLDFNFENITNNCFAVSNKAHAKTNTHDSTDDNNRLASLLKYLYYIINAANKGEIEKLFQ